MLRAPLSIGITLFALGAVDSLVYALGNTYVQEHTDERHRGSVNAFFTIAFLGGIPVGNLAIGGIASKIGSHWALFDSAIVVAICAAAYLAIVPNLAMREAKA